MIRDLVELAGVFLVVGAVVLASSLIATTATGSYPHPVVVGAVWVAGTLYLWVLPRPRR